MCCISDNKSIVALAMFASLAVATVQFACRKPNAEGTAGNDKQSEARDEEIKLTSDAKQIAKWVLSKDGTLVILNGSEIRHITSAQQLPDSEFEIIEINLGNTDTTDQDIKRLGGLPSVQVFQVPFTAITQFGLQSLAGWPKLRLLDLRRTTVHDLSIQEFQSKRPDVLVAWERGDPELLTLLWAADCGDEVECRVNDQVVKNVSDLPDGDVNVTALALSTADVDEDAIARLQQLASLKAIALTDASVSKDEVERLRAALPNCDVRHSPR